MAIPDRDDTFAMLDGEKKYNVRIKEDKNNPNYVTERVYINGECIQLEVGTEIEVPETVYKLLLEKGVI